MIGICGRLPLDPTAHAAVPKMVRYVAQTALAAPEESQDWFSRIGFWPDLLNYNIGDCTIAGVLHAIQQWKKYATGVDWIPLDATALRLYSQFGYNPAVPSTDRGAREIDVLSAWLKGFDVGNGLIDTLSAYAAIDLRKPDEMRYGVQWFGSVYIGLDLPLSIQGPMEDTEWDVSPLGLTGRGAKGSLGGHCALVVGYDKNFLYIITWGRLVRMTWQFWLTYGDEAYALLSSDFTKAPGVTPADIPWQALIHEWEILRPSSLVTPTSP